MDIQATKIELIKQLLDVKKESVLNKVKEILSSEETSHEEIISFTADGKPLSKAAYINHIKSISEEIENGERTFVADEVKDYVLNKKRD